MPLTDTACRQAKPTATRRKLHDTGGLYLEVMPTGRRFWRMRYRLGARRPAVTFGEYPHLGLAGARTERDAARALVAAGIDPIEHRRREATEAAAAPDTFADVAARWLVRQDWTDGHRRTVEQRLSLNLLPWLGRRPIGEITAPDILVPLRLVEQRGARETAHRCRTIVGQVFAFAIAEGLVTANPARDIGPALAKPVEKPLPAVVTPDAFAELLRAIEGFTGGLVVRTALQLAIIAPLRAAELRRLEWDDIDTDAGLAVIPAERMKGKREHRLPLSRQALALLEEVRPLTGRGRYVFPSPRTASGSPSERPLSDGAITAALNRLGYKGVHCGHGFRASFRTIADEVLRENTETLERVLAHTVGSEVERAYSRGQHIEPMRQVLQRWANFVDELRQGATVVRVDRVGAA